MDIFWNNGRCVQLNYKPRYSFVDKSMQNKRIKYYDITWTQINVTCKWSSIIKLSNDIYIHFLLRKEIRNMFYM